MFPEGSDRGAISYVERKRVPKSLQFRFSHRTNTGTPMNACLPVNTTLYYFVGGHGQMLLC